MKKVLYICMLLVLCSACTKDKLLSKINNKSQETLATETSIQPIESGVLLINEFVAVGSEQINEYGREADWVELYNTSSQTIILEEGQWFLTDDIIHNRKKFALPKVKIPAKAHVVVWCDGKGMEDDDIHSNFKLAAGGENIGLYYEKGEKQLVIDSINYTQGMRQGTSFGRVYDGSDAWQSFAQPTIGKKNQDNTSNNI